MNRIIAPLLAFALFLGLSQNAAAQYYERGFMVQDLLNGIEWLRCSVGQQWNEDTRTCDGKIVKLNIEETEQAIAQANEQLEGGWRLPTHAELKSLLCDECGPPKIDAELFPGTTPEAYWTGDKVFLRKYNHWTVNFMTGHSYTRFFDYQQLPVRLVRDRTF